MNTFRWEKSIAEASVVIGKTWPLYSFVTSNPLAGLENKHFRDAVQEASDLFGAKPFPEASLFREALNRKEIHLPELLTLLQQSGFYESPETYLDQLETEPKKVITPENNKLNRIMVKWLSAFMDEGLAEWSMPKKEQGFYSSWRNLAKYDKEVKFGALGNILKTATLALDSLLSKTSSEEILEVFQHHLTSLPGWVGYIKHRQASQNAWNTACPISLLEYLAVRLLICEKLNLSLLPIKKKANGKTQASQLSYIWLKAWERSWQKEISSTLTNKKISVKDKKKGSEIPEAQLVFCIDTRSELIRRNIEATENYETFGYAGFFGISMDYKSEEDGLVRKSCPPIVDSTYLVSETVQTDKDRQALTYVKQNQHKKFKNYFLKRMKNMLPSAFGYVEGSGLLYGVSLVGRTLLPSKFDQLKNSGNLEYENFYEPKLQIKSEAHLSNSIPLQEKITLVKTLFDLMGWQTFSSLIIFVGHGSHSANNPFGSSLDCGACAGNPGRHNARTLASLANEREVREALVKEYGIDIPESTFFLGAEHNTTTDEIKIFSSSLPESHQQALQQLKKNLEKAQKIATAERLGQNKNSIKLAKHKSTNWSETRPEWGLAKNASFIIGPRALTKGHNLEGRCFLQSYNWKTDEDGSALSGIMQGPMVVTQWINNHYYFCTTDNDVFGAGSKITHNVTGKFGVMQGNGGDLKRGLPLQSLQMSDTQMYHQPLRLSVIIEAPIKRVEQILQQHNHLKSLLDKEWIYLLLLDPNENGKIKRYTQHMQWETLEDSLKESGIENEETQLS